MKMRSQECSKGRSVESESHRSHKICNTIKHSIFSSSGFQVAVIFTTYFLVCHWLISVMRLIYGNILQRNFNRS